MGIEKENFTGSWEDFIKLKENDSDDSFYEYINNEIIKMNSPSTEHQMSLLNILDVFRPFFRKSKCLALTAPTDVYLKNDTETRENVVIPDIFVICSKDGLDKNHYTGIPKIIVEVVSDSSKNNIRRDVIVKYNLYARYGVLEYWIVKPYEESVTIFKLNIQTNHYERYLEAYSGEISSYLFPELKMTIEDIFSYF